SSGGTGNATLQAILSGAAGTVTINVHGGAILDGNAGSTNVTAGSLVATSGGDIAAESDPLETVVANLTATTVGGGIFIANTGALNLLGATGGGKAIISAASPLTVAGNCIMAGDITLTAGEVAGDPDCLDDLTVKAGVT